MKKALLVCVVIILVMVGCGNNGNNTSNEQDTDVVILTIASFENNKDLQEQVEIFNNTHSNYHIEIKQYSRFEQEYGDGIKRLQREIVSNNGPDLINFGSQYSVTDIMGMYTVNLLAYCEELSSEEDDTYFDNILDAFTYQDGLYAMPVSFTLQTFAGRKSVLGTNEYWTVEELNSCYQDEKKKIGSSFMLYPGETKKDVFGSLLVGNIGNFVDWEKGTCSFDDNEFRKIINFADQFPLTLNISEDFSPMESFANGKALLYPLRISSVYDICGAEMVLGEDAVYIGYPVNGTDGTVIQASDLMLAISIGSKHKEIAWEFISQFLTEEYQASMTEGFPIRRSTLDMQLKQAQILEYTEDTKGNKIPVAKDEINFEGEKPISINQITKEQADTILHIIERASVGSAYDYSLHSILLEEIDSYFNGDKSLEEVVKVIQRRAHIYISELN